MMVMVVVETKSQLTVSKGRSSSLADISVQKVGLPMAFNVFSV